jgi:hypothetical protein
MHSVLLTVSEHHPRDSGIVLSEKMFCGKVRQAPSTLTVHPISVDALGHDAQDHPAFHGDRLLPHNVSTKSVQLTMKQMSLMNLVPILMQNVLVKQVLKIK